MKYLLVLAVLLVAAWLFFGRRRPPVVPPAKRQKPPPPAAAPQAMLACVHCNVHLPQADALMDVAGRPYCSEAHRLLGPR